MTSTIGSSPIVLPLLACSRLSSYLYFINYVMFFFEKQNVVSEMEVFNFSNIILSLVSAGNVVRTSHDVRGCEFIDATNNAREDSVLSCDDITTVGPGCSVYSAYPDC